MKNRQIKKILLAAAVLTLCFGFCVGFTAANETTEETARGVITSGSIHVALLEKDETGALIEGDSQSQIVPGGEYARVVTIRNTGDYPCWVRIEVEKTFELAAGGLGTGDISLIELDINTEKWGEKDGFYYYLLPLEAGQETEPLFTKVSFHSSIGNLYAGATARVRVTGQAVQLIHNGTTDVFEALGWPEA